VSRRASPLGRWAIVLAFAALTFSARSDPNSGQQLISAAVAYAYFLVVSVAGFFASRARWRGNTRVWSGIAWAFSYMLVPALWWEGNQLLIAFTLGWEFSLAAHSFTMEARARSSSLAECLFFILVDPSLVFTERATFESSPALVISATRASIARCCLGVFALGARVVVDGTLLSEAWSLDEEAGLVLVPPAVVFLSRYCAQSGLASFQLGALRLMGYKLGERYHHPWLASSPGELWRRWNIYLGSWVRRYAFNPVALGLSRALGRRRTSFAKIAATLVCFGFVGLLHCILPWLMGTTNATPVFWFVGQGLLVLAWHGLAGVLRPRLNFERMSWLARPLSALAFWSLFLASIRAARF
jgi:hypothetical protein